MIVRPKTRNPQKEVNALLCLLASTQPSAQLNAQKLHRNTLLVHQFQFLLLKESKTNHIILKCLSLLSVALVFHANAQADPEAKQ